MFGKIKLFFTNWKTSVPALLAMACASDSLAFHIMPEDWAAKGTALCIFMVSIGLIAAKDADKSNASTPNPVAQSVPGRPVVPVVLIVGLAFGLAGCGKSLDQIKQAAHALIDIGGKIYEDVKDDVAEVKDALKGQPVGPPAAERLLPEKP